MGEKYYFIYSSQQNHELCYAVSDFPDRDFVFGGTIVSNGDVGYQGRSDADRLNMTGTTHGSIIEIGGQWYVFYHRLTHKSDYSRQACAERITLLPDGSIPQVPITSCGLNGAPLRGKGIYPAPVACIITNGHMPHGSNKIFTEHFPHVTHEGEAHLIAEISGGTCIGFRYFELDGDCVLTLTTRGAAGRYTVTDESGTVFGEAEIAASTDWQETAVQLTVTAGVHPLLLRWQGEETALLQIAFS